MTTERIDPLAVMENAAYELHDYRPGAKQPMREALDAVVALSKASARTVRAFEGLGKANGVVPTLEAQSECEAALVAQKAALAAFGRQG